MAVRLLDERDIPKFNKGFSNALVGDLRGAIVAADDVSPCEHEMAVKVWSKNLIPFPYYSESKTVNGVTFTVNENGSITINGTSTGAIGLPLFLGEMRLKGNYTLSGVTNTNEGESTHYLQPCVDGQFLTIVANGSRTYTIDGNLTQLSLFVKAGYTFDNVVVYPMFEAGEVASEYIPYVDPASVTVKRCGKNLAKDVGITFEGTGIAWTINDDGTVIANGTAETNCVCNFKVEGWKNALIGKTVTLSGCPAGGSLDTYAVMQRNYGRFDTGNGVTFVIDNNNHGMWGIVVDAGVTVSNLKFAPQLEIGDAATDYEAYREASAYTPESDGAVKGVTSLAPDMTIFTETAGAIVECEYSKDVGAVIEKLTNAIIALGGTV